MSTITSTSTNLVLFKLSGTLPGTEELFPTMSKAMQRFAFKDISEEATESSVGWVQSDDHNATEFTSPAYVWLDKYLFLSLRKDTRKVPAAVLKQEVSDREAAWLKERADTNLKRPPKKTRDEIKEAAKLELLKKTLPVPKVFDAVIDTEKKLVYLLTVSTKEVDLFATMFERTFAECSVKFDDPLALHLLTPWSICTGGVSPLDADKLNALNQAGTDAVIDQIKSNQWIGEEFLLWLISGQAEAAAEGVSAWIDDKVILMGSSDGGPQKVTLTGPVGERMSTLKSAIQEGKQIAEATIHLEDNDGNKFRLTLDGRTFWIKGLKCPGSRQDYATEGADEATERQAEMLYRVASIQDVTKYLFSGFLQAFLFARLNRCGMIQSNIHDWLGEE